MKWYLSRPCTIIGIAGMLSVWGFGIYVFLGGVGMVIAQMHSLSTLQTLVYPLTFLSFAIIALFWGTELYNIISPLTRSETWMQMETKVRNLRHAQFKPAEIEEWQDLQAKGW